MIKTWSTGYDSPNSYAGAEVIAGPSTLGNELNMAKQRAYDNFVAAAKQNSASLGTAYAERHQSISMVTQRAVQLAKGFSQLRKGDVNGMLKTYGISRRTVSAKKVARTKRAVRAGGNVGNLWLEYHFGWEPLVKDVYESVNVLQTPPPYHPNKVRGRGTMVVPDKLVYDDSKTSDFWQKHWIQGRISVLMCANVTVRDPNAFLANQLGLVNPASIAWELVPFSFVVDWFGNVGKFLNSFTDFVGLDVTGATTTTFYQLMSHRTASNWIFGPPTSGVTGNAVSVKRVLGISRPSLHFEIPKGFSPSRALTAISLLLQQMAR